MTTASETLCLLRPDDWHLHIRDGAMLKLVLPYTVRQFGRAIIMPNLRPPVVTSAAARAYHTEILAALPSDSSFQPLMTAYLTDHSTADDLAQGHAEGLLTAVKLYPAHATTNSDHGVSNLRQVWPVLERMQQIGLPLLIHGEVTDPDVDIFDREAVFIDRVLAPLRADFPELRVVLEHATTRQAVDYVRAHAHSGRLAATITAHHLLINRSALFAGGLRPHLYCLPVAKRETHRLALLEAATSGTPCFFLGTDSAPHPVAAKESACGCAGIFTAATALELYAEAFAAAGALDRLEGFASRHGPQFYGLPLNHETVVLERAPTTVPTQIASANAGPVLPFRAGETLTWRLRL